VRPVIADRLAASNDLLRHLSDVTAGNVCLRAEGAGYGAGPGDEGRFRVAAAGIAYLIVEKGVDLSSEAFVGNLLFLGSATSYSLYLVVSRPLLKDLPPVVATAWIFVGSSWTVPFIMFGNSFVSLGVSDAWWTLPWIIIFPTVLTYLLNLYAMVRVPSSVIAFYVFLQPLITATAGVALLSEELTTGVWVAAPCVFLGMLLVMPRRKTLPPLVPMPSTVTAEAAPSSEG
jgi:drug/metabolite transporter (DMT)-like permease